MKIDTSDNTTIKANPIFLTAFVQEVRAETMSF